MVFKNLLGKASMWVLRYCPFPQDVLQCDAQGLAACLKLAAGNRVGMKRVKRLMEAAPASVGVKVGIEGARRKLSSCLDEVEF